MRHPDIKLTVPGTATDLHEVSRQEQDDIILQARQAARVVYKQGMSLWVDTFRRELLLLDRQAEFRSQTRLAQSR